jgi:hypothetical protein
MKPYFFVSLERSGFAFFAKCLCERASVHLVGHVFSSATSIKEALKFFCQLERYQQKVGWNAVLAICLG